MRLSLALLILLFAGQVCHAQQYCNNFSLVYVTTSTSVATIGSHPDDQHYNYNYNYTVTSGPRFGLAYTRYIFKWFAVETDVLYMRNNVTALSTYNNDIIHNSVNQASIQGFVKISFLKYLFVDAGIAADAGLDQGSNITWAQEGVAAEAGLGAKLTFNHFTLSVNPYMRTHGDITLDKVDSNNKLNEQGIKFSVGYDF